jgi:hypothetical protein
MMCYASVLSFYDEKVVGIFEKKKTELSKIWTEFRMDLVHTWIWTSRVLNVVPLESVLGRLQLI